MTLASDAFTASGLVNGDAVNAVSLSSPGAAAGANVASYAITASGAVGSGLGNYAVTYAPGQLTVNPATLTYVASAASMTYGGDVPTLGGAVTGFVNGQTVATATTGALAFGTSASGSSNVGAYAITGSGLTADNGNYVFVQAPANASALTVNPATLTYVASAASMTYGGSVPTLGGAVTGFVNGQTAATATTGALAFGTSATGASNVGAYAVTGSGLTADNGNYVFVQAPANASALTVNPATLTYIAGAASMTYGGDVPTLGGAVTGFVNGQTVATATTGALAFGTSATGASNVGAYAVTGSGLTADNGNYVFVQAPANASALTVNPATLTYIAGAASMTYGGDVPTLGGAVTGFVNGQTVATATTGALAFGTSATGASNVGAYAVTGSGLTADNGNYVFVQAPANASALTVNPATLTYIAGAASMIYGGDVPTLGGAVTGFVNGQTVATATTGALAFGTSATGASNVGAYAVTGSGLTADNGNYVFVQAPANATAMTVNPATLTYIASAAGMTYGGGVRRSAARSPASSTARPWRPPPPARSRSARARPGRATSAPTRSPARASPPTTAITYSSRPRPTPRRSR